MRIIGILGAAGALATAAACNRDGGYNSVAEYAEHADGIGTTGHEQAGAGGSGTTGADGMRSPDGSESANRAEGASASDPGTGGSGTSAMDKTAGDRTQQTARPGTVAATGPVTAKYVKDNAAALTTGAVKVQGEIEQSFDGRSFVLESGGLFNDEIFVVVPKGVKASGVSLAEDSKVVVTGKVRTIGVVEIERELGWDLQPEIEVELEGNQTVLVAERIDRR